MNEKELFETFKKLYHYDSYREIIEFEEWDIKELVAELNKTIAKTHLPKEFIKMFWSLSDDGYEQMVEAYEHWIKNNEKAF